MPTPASLELISFELCPYVQRSVITLIEKGMDFKITYIDLANRPEWFMQISPLGKVPVLRAEGAVIFESAVINEYIDETSLPALHPAEPLQRAINRSWIEFGSGLLVSQYGMMTAGDQAGFDSGCREIREKFAQIEKQLSTDGDFFNGQHFSLVDAAFAPLFMRLTLLEKQIPGFTLIISPRISAWRNALLARPSVQQSVLPDFPAKFMAYLRKSNTYLASRI